MASGPYSYPFSALVGQDDARLALLLLAVDPRIGGVLLTGEKGTAKSTAVRGLAKLVPGSPPFRTLPLNATEDRVAGGLDISECLAQGRPVFAPGVLADVHGGVLYVDEVNLLAPHLADLVTTAAAAGEYCVEREGFSVTHASEFALVGTMNPEEGPIRPQLLDRFGLSVTITGEQDPTTRVQLLKRRMAFDADPEGFTAEWAHEEHALTGRIVAARELLPDVVCTTAMHKTISELANAAHVAGLRADLVWQRAARAHAAWNSRDAVTFDDVMAVAEFVLSHRRRDSAPPTEPRADSQDGSDAEDDSDTESSSATQPNAAAEQQPDPREGEADQQAQRDQTGGATGQNGDGDDTDSEPAEPASGGEPAPPHADEVAAVGEPFDVTTLQPVSDRGARDQGGKRQRRLSPRRRGRYLRARRSTRADDLAVDATLRAAAPYQQARRAARDAARQAADEPARATPAVIVTPADWHRKVREHHASTCVVFCVDASGSMGALGRMAATKGAVLSLLLDAYTQRDQVAMVAFRRDGAKVLVPPTPSVDVAAKHLRELPTGGRTPLAAGLVATNELLAPLLRRDPTLRPLAVVLSDGRANLTLDGSKRGATREALAVARKVAADQRVTWVVVDTEDTSKMRLGLAQGLADALGATLTAPDGLRARDLLDVAQDHQPGPTSRSRKVLT